jgi:cation diffusion facilitator family transporter
LAGGSKKAVYAALFGNLGIAVTKFVAAFFTGSPSMFAEAYHSASDTFNQVLLLIGLRTSARVASDRHQFGYGKDMFFWSFIVATMLFGVSGVLSIEHGISSLADPHTIEKATISYVVLAIAFAFEANALRIAYVLFKQTIEARGEKVNMRTLVIEFKESKDPTIITVMVEDAAALLGIVIAGIGVFLSDVTGNPFFDAASSLTIGVLLMAFAFFLARENRGLLLGESITGDESSRIRELVKAVPGVRSLVSMRTMHLGTHDVIVGIEVSLVDGLDTGRVAAATDEIEQRVREVLPYAKQGHIFIEVEKHDLSKL